jgi:hypothetical protein
MKKLIEIGLMSYNQVEGLIKTICNLECIISHPRNDFYDIELYISDNFSTDASWDQILLFQSKYPNKVKINRHETNTLFFGNFAYLIENMKAQFGLILGCGDEIILDNFFLFLDELYSVNSKTTREIAMCVLGEAESSHTDYSKLNVSTSPIRISDAVSCNVFNLSLLKQVSFESEASKIWPHLQLGLDILKHNKNLIFCKADSQIISLDRPNNGWYTSLDFFDILEFRDLIVFSEASIQFKLSVNYTELKFQGKLLASLIYRNRNVTIFRLNKKILIKIFKTYKHDILILIYILVMSFFPLSFIRIVSKIYHFKFLNIKQKVK